MEQRKLGTQGLTAGAIGLGCMGMSYAYGTPDDAESIATIRMALDRGVTMLDTAESYGPYTNEVLIGQAIRGHRDQVVIATKYGFTRDANDVPIGLDGSPANARRVLEASLKRLGVDVIDLYLLHRPDPKVPIEDSAGAMGDLVREGKARYIGVCEASAETVRRAHRAFPLSAVQSEYSLWERGIEAEVLPTLRELGIGFVPFSPLGRGFLTGAFQSAAEFAEGDLRRSIPRMFEHAAANVGIVEAVKRVAARRGCTPAQVALAWVLTQGDDIVPIPGTKRRKYLEENLGALEVKLTPEDLAEIGGLASTVKGERYAAWIAQFSEKKS
jgi:aryl-alcohol dehydrogenase-like predicted oxidoreductase